MEINQREVSRDSDKYRTIVENFQKLCEFEPIYYPFPGGLPVSIMKKNINQLRQNKYKVCDKSDGTRYMLYIRTINNGTKKVGYLINRSMKIYEIDMDLGVVAHIGTVYDGELVKTNNGEWVYLIFDVFATKGMSIKNLTSHSKRIDFASSNKYIEKINIPFSMRVKKFYLHNSSIDYNKILYSVDYETDGIIFTPENRKIFNGTDKGTFKWKSPELSTIDFQIKYTKEDKYSLVLWDNKTKVEIYQTILMENKLKDEINELLKMNQVVIVECKWKNITNPSWIPIKVRDDKSHPNSVKTYMSTVETIKENLTLSDLVF